MLFPLLLSMWRECDFSSVLLCLVVPFFFCSIPASTSASTKSELSWMDSSCGSSNARHCVLIRYGCAMIISLERLSLMRVGINTFGDDSHLRHYLMQCVLLKYSELDTLFSYIINSW